MCADGAKAPGQRFAYKHAFDALVRISREEGVATFSRGLGPNIVRSVIMSEFKPISLRPRGNHQPTRSGPLIFTDSSLDHAF